MNKYRFRLEPYRGMNTRYNCPGCKHRHKTFSRYIDTETGEHIHPSVGRCNRENNCQYHYTPGQYFKDNSILFDTSRPKPYTTPISKPALAMSASFIDSGIFKRSLQSYDANHFVTFLVNRFGIDIANQLISRYFIGTSKHWPGATVFWQIDIQSRIKAGKIMLYNPHTGYRVKEPFEHITWEHKVLKLSDFELRQCLFGEHLIRDKTKPVAIVESEKTAVIASAFFPKVIWLAAGSLSGLNVEKCKVLSGRAVTLFPDLKAFNNWSEKAKELSSCLGGTKFNVSDLLERKASANERKSGFDLADYLIRFDHHEFAKPEPIQNRPNRPQHDEVLRSKSIDL